MTTKRKPKLSRRSDHLIESLADDAMRHGWQSDQGTGDDAERAKADYEESLAELKDHVLKLEQKLRRLQGRCVLVGALR